MVLLQSFSRAFESLEAVASGRSISALLHPLFEQVASSCALRVDSLGFWGAGGERFWLPRFIFQRTRANKPRIKLGIFAGIHGDEPAGVLGLIDFLRALDSDPEGGFIDGTRWSRSGWDLNREFWRNSDEPEVVLLEKELERQRFDGIIALHTDDTSDGVLYGFVGGALLTKHLLEPALAAAEQALPKNTRGQIDGFHAVNGIIHSRYDGILSPSPGSIRRRSKSFLRLRSTLPRRAFVLALECILFEYRRMISFASNI